MLLQTLSAKNACSCSQVGSAPQHTYIQDSPCCCRHFQPRTPAAARKLDLRLSIHTFRTAHVVADTFSQERLQLLASWICASAYIHSGQPMLLQTLSAKNACSCSQVGSAPQHTYIQDSPCC